MLLFLAYKSLFERRAKLDFQSVYFLSLSLTLGSVVASYRKTHLCDVEIPGQGPMRESNYTMPGHTLELPVRTPAGKVGVGKGNRSYVEKVVPSHFGVGQRRYSMFC